MGKLKAAPQQWEEHHLRDNAECRSAAAPGPSSSGASSAEDSPAVRAWADRSRGVGREGGARAHKGGGQGAERAAAAPRQPEEARAPTSHTPTSSHTHTQATHTGTHTHTTRSHTHTHMHRPPSSPRHRGSAGGISTPGQPAPAPRPPPRLQRAARGSGQAQSRFKPSLQLEQAADSATPACLLLGEAQLASPAAHAVHTQPAHTNHTPHTTHTHTHDVHAPARRATSAARSGRRMAGSASSAPSRRLAAAAWDTPKACSGVGGRVGGWSRGSAGQRGG